MYDCVILTTRNIAEVAQASGKEFNELVKTLLAYSKKNIYPVKIPIRINHYW